MNAKDFLRRIVNRKSYSYKTELLIKYREKALNSSSVCRFVYLHKYNAALRFFSCDIPIETKIGEGLSLPHGGNGIFISRGAVIGKNCVIFQQVTIGSNTLKDTKNPGAPILGDNVYIGAGAKIIGGVHVGNNVRIGANAVVVRDVPDNTTVVLSDIKIIYKNNASNCFLSYTDKN